MNASLRDMAVKFSRIANYLVKATIECAVCLDDFDSEKSPVRINCIHTMCHRCALLWLEKSRTNEATCPTCHTEYRKEHITVLECIDHDQLVKSVKSKAERDTSDHNA